MTRCLREYTLVMLYIGEGTHEDRVHLASCDTCAQHYQQLVRDWHRIGNILHTAPPPRIEGRPSPSFAYRWGPIATALVATLLLIITSARWWQPTAPTITPTMRQEETVSFVETTVVPALFTEASLLDVAPPTPISDETYVQAALDGEWPCEQEESTATLNCGIHTYAMLIGG